MFRLTYGIPSDGMNGPMGPRVPQDEVSICFFQHSENIAGQFESVHGFRGVFTQNGVILKKLSKNFPW